MFRTFAMLFVPVTAALVLTSCAPQSDIGPTYTTYNLSITGSGKADIQILGGPSDSDADGTTLPYSTTKQIGSLASVTLIARRGVNPADGDLTCTITDKSGKVLDTQTGSDVQCGAG